MWQLKLNLRLPISSTDFSLLSKDERARALYFYRHEDRVRAIATRAALRRLLVSGLRQPPTRYVLSPINMASLFYGMKRAFEFNVSHAGNFSLIALSTEVPIGVDIDLPKFRES